MLATMNRLRVLAAPCTLLAPMLLRAQTIAYTAGPLRLVPAGRLAHYVSPGWGAAGAVTWRGASGAIGLRLEVAYASFPFAPADHFDLRTTAQVPVLLSSGGSRLTLLAGPELAVRFGSVNTSAHVGVGVAGAFSAMTLGGLGTDDRYNQLKRFSDFAPAMQGGAGVGVRVARGVRLDLAAAFGVLGPTAYGLGDRIRVGVISGPYWGPRRQWSEYSSYRVGVVVGPRG